MPTAGRVVVVGSSHVDFTIILDTIPRVGETVIGKGFKLAPGGKGANQAVAAARLGAEVYMVSRVGRDHFGKTLLKNFKLNGVRTDYVFEDVEAHTGIAFILVDSSGRNTIAVAPGADLKVSREDVEKASEVISSADVVLLQLEIPLETVAYAIEEAWREGVCVVLTPAPAQPIPDSVLSKVNVLTPNEIEAEMLTKIRVHDLSDAAAAGRKLLEKGVDAVVITLGDKGALLVDREGEFHVPALPVKPIDTTGAGDCFSGALGVAIAEGLTMREAVIFANTAAGLSTTKIGAQEGMPTREEVKQALTSKAT
ncbi:MAG: ribokinase [Candidatus Jordarchaeales archaeon]|nr:ribokinase [Candidatus Jordarchaeia archaeon]